MVDYERYMNKIVLVDWSDSITAQGWHDTVDLSSPLPTIASVGLFLGYTGEYIALAGDWHDSSHNRIMRIPKGCIKEVKVL